MAAARCVRDPRRDCRPKKKEKGCSFIRVSSRNDAHTCDYVSYLSGFVNKKKKSREGKEKNTKKKKKKKKKKEKIVCE